MHRRQSRRTTRWHAAGRQQLCRCGSALECEGFCIRFRCLRQRQHCSAPRSRPVQGAESGCASQSMSLHCTRATFVSLAEERAVQAIQATALNSTGCSDDPERRQTRYRFGLVMSTRNRCSYRMTTVGPAACLTWPPKKDLCAVCVRTGRQRAKFVSRVSHAQGMPTSDAWALRST